jgi:hypothetical protein
MDEFLSPSFLPWWGWLLCAAGAWSVCITAGKILDDQNDDGIGGWVFTVLVGLAALFVTGLGVIRFVKWAWAG